MGQCLGLSRFYLSRTRGGAGRTFQSFFFSRLMNMLLLDVSRLFIHLLMDITVVSAIVNNDAMAVAV